MGGQQPFSHTCLWAKNISVLDSGALASRKTPIRDLMLALRRGMFLKA
jgi:hypothetical protein